MILPLAIVAFQAGSSSLPRPTGRNGYEEYVQAADILRGPEASVYINWTPGQKPPEYAPSSAPAFGGGVEFKLLPPPKEIVDLHAHLNKLSPLDVRREAVRRFGRALDLIAQGSTKPVLDPRQSVDLTTSFPEFAGFKQVTKFAVLAASVYAADGRTDLATKALLDQLTFGDNFGRGVMISNLVSVAVSAIALRSFEELLPRMSLRDAESVSITIKGLLARKPSAIDTMAAEGVFARSAVQTIANAKPGELQKLTSGGEEAPDPVEKRMSEEFVKLTPAGRKALFQTIDRKLQERLQRRIRILQGPERSWLPGLTEQAEADDANPASLSDYLVSIIDGSTAVSFVQANLRARTQLRLLNLYAQAIAHRWETGKWPSKLDAVDPLSGEPFLYEIRQDGSIRIASKGTKETGEIGLIYQRPKLEPEVRP